MNDIKNENVSFVMPAYNCADTIAESVESIVQGNFEEGDELIIVDDCSTDNTAQVLSDLKRRYPFIEVIRNAQNKGCPASRNVGIARASNPLIFNLDSDNILVPGSIRKLKLFMISEKADLAAFGEIHYFAGDKNKVTHKWICRPGVLTLADFLSGHINPGPAGNFMYTKESWQRVGRYWEYGPGLHEAWGFSLKQIAMGSKFVVMPNTYYFHRYGHASLFIRESKKKNESSLMAMKMIMPFIDLIDENDAAYIMSEEGRISWIDNLAKRPIRLKTGEAGKTGRIEYLKSEEASLVSRIAARVRSIIKKETGIPK
jgi:glycosyltransferase involved in cell wall biosynthesis